MLTRSMLLLSLPIVLMGGCANETPLVAGYSAPMSTLAISAPPAELTSDGPMGLRKTMSDKVLTAIALERVTGMKPDPARFAE